ncbi:hypothetical protein VTO42DRAFT_7432 [Malbranchea cinnamomea]
MPKSKTLLKEAKGKKKARRSEPESADEYLAEGVELEEAGEKWRGGDAVKAMRFFMRAIEMYDTGLKRHPTSFDLAYNKARVQYEITQHPKLASQLPAPMIEILHIALRSHRDALDLQQDSPDILFNTAQVLTSLAEVLTEGKRPSEARIQEAVKYLHEALDLFQRCLALQELRYTESQEQIKMIEFSAFEEQQAPPPVEQPSQSEGRASPTQSEQWATVIEPVTKNALVDTAVAQLEALATLCALLTSDSGSSLAWIEEYSSDLQEKIASYADGTDRQHDLTLARAKFISSMAEVSYRGGRIDAETYKNELNRAFNDIDLSQDPAGLCSKGEALVSFNLAVADTYIIKDQDGLNRSLNLRWQSLSTALDCLSAASKIASTDNLPKIHIARGDVELYRWRLGRVPWNYAMASNNASILINNAQTYYRGGAAFARRDGWAEDEREGSIKEALAKALSGDVARIQELMASAREEVMRIAEDMVEDGLVAGEDMEKMFSAAEPDVIVF